MDFKNRESVFIMLLKVIFLSLTYYIGGMSFLVSLVLWQSSCEEHGTNDNYKMENFDIDMLWLFWQYICYITELHTNIHRVDPIHFQGYFNIFFI